MRRYQSQSYGILDSEKEALNRAFKALRKQGFIARQNHQCCGSCSGCAIASDVGRMLAEKRDAVMGAVHYHRQAYEGMMEGQLLHIQFGRVHLNKVGDFGLPTEEVGKALLDALLAEGLHAQWDGDVSKCVEVPFQGSFSRWSPPAEEHVRKTA